MSRLVIVGAGHGAGQLIASLRQNQYPDPIVLIGAESYLPYQRPPLSKKYLSGELPPERLYVKPFDFYESHGLKLMLSTRVCEIDRGAQFVKTTDGRTIGYGALVLATGSRPRKIDVPGSDLSGVHYLRGIDDVDAIRADLDGARNIVVIGAGYIGLEVAAVCRSLGRKVSVVEMADRVMCRVVSPEVSTFYERVHRDNGVELHLGASLQGFEGSGRISGVCLTDGQVLEADLVVVGIGIEPRTELAALGGLAVDNGIDVDQFGQTSDSRIYAMGDCTRHPSRIYGRKLRLESVQNALDQARTVASNLSGLEQAYDQVPWFWSDQYDLKLQIAGLSQDYDRTIIRGSVDEKSFSCLYLAGKRLLAVDAVNRPKDFVQAKSLIGAQAQIDFERAADDSTELKELARDD